jgi:hypothetical protein
MPAGVQKGLSSLTTNETAGVEHSPLLFIKTVEQDRFEAQFQTLR